MSELRYWTASQFRLRSQLGRAAAGFGVAPEELEAMPAAELDTYGGAMLKDETTCIRCAMCVVLPPGAAHTSV